MRRLLLGLLLGALIFGVSFAGAKLATVTNPMSANLDAAGFNISSVGSLTATGNISAQSNIQTSGYFVGSHLVAFGGVVTVEPSDTASFDLTGGRADPTGSTANVGTLYVRTVTDTGGHPHAQVWVKSGETDADWTCALLCA